MSLKLDSHALLADLHSCSVDQLTTLTTDVFIENYNVRIEGELIIRQNVGITNKQAVHLKGVSEFGEIISY